MSDTYETALKVLRELNPMVQAPDGTRIAMVAAFLSPTAEHEQNLKLRRLVEDYLQTHNERDQHGDCLCFVCERARAVLNRPKLEPLPLFAEVGR